MKSLQKIGGLAAVVWAVILMWAIVHLAVILPANGFASPEGLYDPGQGMPYLLDRPFLTIEYFVTFIYALVIALMVVALHGRLHSSETDGRVQIAYLFGMATVALNLAEGAVGLLGKSVILALSQSNMDAAQGLFLSIMTVHDSLLFAGIFSVGVWIAAISWASLGTKTLPRPLAILGVAAGLQAIGAIVVPLLSLPLLPLLWSLWLGITLLGTQSLAPAAGRVQMAPRHS